MNRREMGQLINMLRHNVEWINDCLAKIKENDPSLLGNDLIGDISMTRTYVSLVNELCQKTTLRIHYCDCYSEPLTMMGVLSHGDDIITTSTSTLHNNRARKLSCATTIWDYCLNVGIVEREDDHFIVKRYYIDLESEVSNAMEELDLMFSS